MVHGWHIAHVVAIAICPMELNQVTLPARDMTASVAFYRSMGFELIVEAQHYARFKSLKGEATFSLSVCDATAAPSRTVLYFECADLDMQVHALQAKGMQFTQEPKDEPWLWREARFVDPSGNEICLYHAGVYRLNPPWRA